MVAATNTGNTDGTRLADVPSVPPVLRSTPDAVWRTQRDRFFLRESRGTSRTTIGAGLFIQAALVGILIYAHYPAWRIAALAGLYIVFVVAHAVIMRTTRE